MNSDIFLQIAYYCGALPGIEVAWLFGSAVSDRLRADSDLDLALLCDYAAIPAYDELAHIKGNLEDIAHRTVDLVLLNDTSPILAFQVIKTGRVLFCRKRIVQDRYVMKVLSEYADFKLMRQPLEANVIKRRIL